MATPFAVVYFEYTTTRVSSDHNSHMFCSFFMVVIVVVCVVGLVFLFFVAPFSLLAVFYQATAFNSDVSNWNTGAVTRMDYSKCTRSLPLCGHGAFRCGVLLNIYGNSRFVGSQVSHVLFLFLVVV